MVVEEEELAVTGKGARAGAVPVPVSSPAASRTNASQ